MCKKKSEQKTVTVFIERNNIEFKPERTRLREKRSTLYIDSQFLKEEIIIKKLCGANIKSLKYIFLKKVTAENKSLKKYNFNGRL